MSPRNLLSERYPEVYAQIHVELTNDYYPHIDIPSLTAGTQALVWWQCPKEKIHVWVTPIAGRARYGSGCPICSGRLTLPGWNCLKSTFPESYKELHFDLNRQEGIDVRYLAPKAPTKVWWQCQVDPEHVWQARISHRTSGVKSGCPKCHTFKTESEFRKLFNDFTNLTFESGHIIAERELFKRNKVQIDIVNHEHKIAIEYDGRFTHGGNTLYRTTKEECFAKDTDSTQAILKAGYTIIRIRESPLANLALKHPELKQLKYKDKSDKSGTLQAAITYLQTRKKTISLIAPTL